MHNTTSNFPFYCFRNRSLFLFNHKKFNSKKSIYKLIQSKVKNFNYNLREKYSTTKSSLIIKITDSLVTGDITFPSNFSGLKVK